MSNAIWAKALLILAQMGREVRNAIIRRQYQAREAAIKADPVSEWNARVGGVLRPAAGTAEELPTADPTATAGDQGRGDADPKRNGPAAAVLRASGEVPPLMVKRVGPGQILPPTRATDGSAGFDLRAAKAMVIPAGAQVVVPTGWAMAIPPGWCGQIWPRSGLAIKAEIDRRAGLIDDDYREEVRLVLRNEGLEPFEIVENERVGQMVLVPYLKAPVVVVEELPPATRTGGFGSTGMH